MQLAVQVLDISLNRDAIQFLETICGEDKCSYPPNVLDGEKIAARASIRSISVCTSLNLIARLWLVISREHVDKEMVISDTYLGSAPHDPPTSL